MVAVQPQDVLKSKGMALASELGHGAAQTTLPTPSVAEVVPVQPMLATGDSHVRIELHCFLPRAFLGRIDLRRVAVPSAVC